jgi:sugar transferase (PEP-CTERM system associated)
VDHPATHNRLPQTSYPQPSLAQLEHPHRKRLFYMIRIFNHYLHRRTLLQILFDVGFVVLVVMLAVLAQAQDVPSRVVPLAVTHGFSLAAALFVINTGTGFYDQSHSRSLIQTCARAVLVLVLALPLAYAIFSLLPSDVASRDAIKLAAMFGVAAVVGHRVYAAHAGSNPRVRTRILIYGCGPAAKLVGRTLKNADPHADILGYVRGPNETQQAVSSAEVLDGHRPLDQIAAQLGVDEIIVALTERRGGSMPLRELLDCKLAGVRVYDIATHFEKTLSQIRVDYAHAGWLIFGDGFSQGLLRTAVKRLFDMVCSALLIVFTLPVMAACALMIRLESRGPVLYRQERVGLNGKPFKVIKFRSMTVDAEKDGQPRWATKQDSRVTRIGREIRKLRIDELPQLFNVLKGEMSLVGPRPERPYFVEQLTQQIPFYACRHSVKPGVTGWAQVRYHYGATVEDSQEKLQYDLYYVKNNSLFIDLVVLFETVAVVLLAKGAR